MRTVLVLLANLVITPLVLWAQPPVDYATQVKPLLVQRCYTCHAALRQKSDLRLDTAESLRHGGSRGPAIVPGKSSESLLITAVTGSDGWRMPPESEGEPLSDSQIALLRSWIDEGAVAPSDERPEEDPREHWAFRRPERAAPPVVANPEWSANPVDAFIHEQLEQRGLHPSPSADRSLLLRRVYLDLIGLPPDRHELRAFLADSSPGAYERVVDRLLASPRYGERWARHWMDVWRYSDWYGRRAVPDVMNSYPQIWRWRDWIVRSLNEDQGYDQMVVEMLAADEVRPTDDESVVATGFIVRNWYKWNYNTWMKDMVEHTGKAFLGLTLNCAHCHDHKYDPISQEEYFKFRAFFEPLELRHDRVAGLPDPGPFKKYVYAESYGPIAAGSIRVFDEQLNAETWMYSRGDSRNRIPGRPAVAPGVPTLLGGETFQVQPVELPPTAWYPGLKPFVQQEETAQARSAVDEAQAALQRAKEALAAARDMLAKLQVHATDSTQPLVEPNAATPPNAELLAAQTALTDAELNVRAELAHCRWLQAQFDSLQAKIQADNARFAAAPGNPAELARSASLAERAAAVENARWQAVLAERALLLAQRKAATDEQARAEVVTVEQSLASARQAVAKAELAMAEDSDLYSPLGPIYPSRSTGRRAALARWIASPENPLTARVAVNHIWARHFGQPLVETMFNFGRGGKRPTHPRLLDWLATELMDQGWTQKHLHRLIVTSQTYRQCSSPARDDRLAVAQANRALDPDNTYLWHYPARRIEAEVVRDSVLHVARELDSTMGGVDIDYHQGLHSKRRSLYFTHHGEEKMLFLDLFDGANACDCYRRSQSIVPQQALALSNSELTLNQSRLLARKLWAELPPGDPAQQPTADQICQDSWIDAAFEQVLCRAPSPAERDATRRFLARQVALYQEQPIAAASSGAEPSPNAAETARRIAAGTNVAPSTTHHPDAASATSVAHATDPVLHAWESLMHALLNHNDFVTIR